MTVEHIHLAPKVIQSRDLALQLYIAASNRYGKSNKISQVFLRLTKAFDRAQDAMASAYINGQSWEEFSDEQDIYFRALVDRSVLIEPIVKGSMRTRQPPFNGHEHFLASRAISKISRTLDRCKERFVNDFDHGSQVTKRIEKARLIAERAWEQLEGLETQERD